MLCPYVPPQLEMEGRRARSSRSPTWLLLSFAKYGDQVGLSQSSAHSQRGSTNAFVCTGATCRALSRIASFRPVSVTIFCEHQ